MRVTLARAAAPEGILEAAERIVLGLRDQALRERAAIASQAEARYAMLQQLAKRPEGDVYREEAARMHDLLEAERKPRAKRAKKSAVMPPARSAPATTGAHGAT